MVGVGAVVGVMFIAVFSYDFVYSEERVRQVSDVVGIIAVLLGGLKAIFLFDVRMISFMLIIVALMGHVFSRTLTDERTKSILHH